VVDADLDAGLAELDSIRRLAVLRVVQEGLTNVVKHAGPATHATVSARVDGAAVRITITDDGVGTPSRRPGFGLVGMRERVELLGGRVDVRGRAPGWALMVTMPVGDQS
jgi:signal transduction histidine kinase